MDLLKLEKQLLKDLVAARPDGHRHNVSIDVSVSRGRISVKIYGWYCKTGLIVADDGVMLWVDKKTSIKAAVSEFYVKLHEIDNKAELNDND